ncbi:MAG: uracil-DNA glycosylase [bacterium]
MATLEELNEKIRQCGACPLHEGRTHAVPGEGNPHAELLFIGEGPGQKEDETGRPFVGAAGKFLEELLAGIGKRREDVFIANVVKCRPPGNRDPLPDEVNMCTSLYLFEQIALIKPLIIITLGRHSMHRFLPEDFQISRVHGQPFRRNGQVYLPLYHPAAALYQGSLRTTLEADFRKIPAILKKITDEHASPQG